MVNGVPSIGKMVMVGSGVLGKQPTSKTVTLPVASEAQYKIVSSASIAASTGTGKSAQATSGAVVAAAQSGATGRATVGVLAVFAAAALCLLA